MFKAVLCLVISFCLVGCTTHIMRKGYKLEETQVSKKENYTYQVPIKKRVDLTHQPHQVLGSVTMGDSGFSVKCGTDYVLALLENEALAVGANLINITWEKMPDLGSSCFRVTAQLIKIEDEVWAKGLRTDPQYRVGYYVED